MLKLAVFDVDGTLKMERDPYTYLHRCLGVTAKADAITAAGRSGQLAYTEWLRADAMLWRGTPRAELVRWLQQTMFVPGARDVVHALQAQGVEVALLSAGLLLHVELVAEELGGIRHIFGNELLFATDGRGAEPWVSGEVRAHVPVTQKGEILARLQADLGIMPDETLAVGDTRSDMPMFARAAIGVAVAPAQPDVAAAAEIVLPTLDLTSLLTQVQTLAPEWIMLNSPHENPLLSMLEIQRPTSQVVY